MSAGAARAGSMTESKIAEKSRDGFSRGVVQGLIGMALAGVTGGRLQSSAEKPPKPLAVEHRHG